MACPGLARGCFRPRAGTAICLEVLSTVFWQKVRAEADIEDVRCHDLRHTYASVALAHGETILTIGRLLGHNDPATTLKYTHLADAAVHEAAETLVPILGGED